MTELYRVKTVPDFLVDSPLSHAPGVFGQEPSYALRKIVAALSHKIIIDNYAVRRILELAEQGPVIYALKYRSYFDVHYLRLKFAQLGLPVPCYAFDTKASKLRAFGRWLSMLRKDMRSFNASQASADDEAKIVGTILRSGGSAVFFLVDEKTTRTRYVHPETDPVNILMDVQSRMAASISILPMMILYERGQRRTTRPYWEELLGDPDRPGLIKRILTAVRQWTVPELLVGSPVHLVAEFEEFGAENDMERLNFQIRNKLIHGINERVRVNRGPERMSRTEIKERVLQDAKVQKAIEEIVSRNNLQESEIRNKAESFVEEMAGDQRIQVHHFLFHLLKWLFGKIFTEIDFREQQFEALKRENENGSLIYVSCHKSHLDYLLIGYLSFINQMAIPYMAAGKNLSFWPVGPILRNAGAFFIRRSFQKLGSLTRLYTRVFEAYLKVLITEKINVNFYIEGGRSRTGKLLPPRLGMLSFLLQAVDEGHVHDLAFVPSFVAYDQVPEEGSYLRELAGTEKEKESFWSFLGSRHVLKKKYGKAYIRFHRPVSYKAFLRMYSPDKNLGKLDAVSTRKIYHDFAYHLMNGIARAGVVTPVELTSASLLSPGSACVSRESVLESAESLYQALDYQKTELATSFIDLQSAVESSLLILIQRGFIETLDNADKSEKPSYQIRATKRMNLDYYRNALLNFVWAPSLVALSLLANEKSNTTEESYNLLESFTFFKNVLGKELIWDPLISDENVVESSLNFFEVMTWINKDMTLAQPKQLRIIGSVARDLLRVYYLSLVAAGDIEDGGVTQKDFARIINDLGLKMSSHNNNNVAPPVVTMVSVENALSTFSEMGIFQYRPGKKFLEKVINEPKRLLAQQRLFQALSASV